MPAYFLQWSKIQWKNTLDFFFFFGRLSGCPSKILHPCSSMLWYKCKACCVLSHCRPSYVVPTNLFQGIKAINPMFRGYSQQVGHCWWWNTFECMCTDSSWIKHEDTLLHRDTFAGQLSWSKKWISFAFAPRALQIMRILCRRYEYKTWIMVWTELNPWKWICAELGLLCVRRPDYEVAPDRIQSLPLFFSAPYPSVSVTEITEAESFASQLVLFTCKCSHQT